jgi:hypothetical protein
LSFHVRPSNLGDALEVATNLRPEDVFEFDVGGYGDHVEAAATMHRLAGDHARTAVWQGKPVFCFGVIPITQHNTYALYGYGTLAAKRAFPALTRYGRDFWVPHLFDGLKARRVEVRVPVASVHSINWLTACGMRQECVVEMAACTDDPMVQLVITRNDYVLRRRLSTSSASSDTGTIADV